MSEKSTTTAGGSRTSKMSKTTSTKKVNWMKERVWTKEAKKLGLCFVCGQKGHLAIDCYWTTKPSELSEKELSLEEMQRAHDEMIKGLEFEVDERKCNRIVLLAALLYPLNLIRWHQPAGLTCYWR